MKNIAVIGMGSIGRRHLQSLQEMGDEFRILGVDKNPETVKRMTEEFKGKVEMCDTIEGLPDELDACVIATASGVRRRVFEDLIKSVCVKNILFEKVLFQKKEDYYWTAEKLRANGIHAWVNCARREWDSYRWVKNELQDMKSFVYTVTGGEWGLCCNGIHMIDLMLYLSDENEYSIDQSEISHEIIASKRKGFYELYGTLNGHSGKCRSFQISCLRGTETPSLVLIGSDVCNIMIDEAKQLVHISKADDGWEWHEREFPLLYVSQLTAGIIKSMLGGVCNLPTYELSMKEHLVFIDALQGCFNRNGWEDKELCPIT